MIALRLADMSAVAASPGRGHGWFGWAEFGWFVTLLATALAMGGALAHALTLPNKIMMDQADYFAHLPAFNLADLFQPAAEENNPDGFEEQSNEEDGDRFGHL